MWLLTFSIYVGCKWLTWRRAPTSGVPLWRQAAYLLLWPGMNASAFLPPSSSVARPPTRAWFSALGKTLLGAVVFFGLARWLPYKSAYLTGWVGMIGIVFMLHFGACDLASCAWRAAGVNARPLMNWPLASVSLGEFWGERWNTAFRDLTYRFLFRPLARRFRPLGAILAGFLISGLVHEIVISIPAGGGYGGPTVFFLLQAVGIVAERSRFGRAIGLRNGLRGWAFTMCIVMAPACALFHPPFVLRIVVPFMRAVGAI
jgi:alginate O-acetyltransferase complex protein AlgI